MIYLQTLIKQEIQNVFNEQMIINQNAKDHFMSEVIVYLQSWKDSKSEMRKFQEDFQKLKRSKLDYYYQKINEKALENKQEYIDLIFKSEK